MKSESSPVIQPTGDIHLGKLLRRGQGLGGHAAGVRLCLRGGGLPPMTMPFNPAKLREATWKMTFQLLACGIDPEHVFIPVDGARNMPSWPGSSAV